VTGKGKEKERLTARRREATSALTKNTGGSLPTKERPDNRSCVRENKKKKKKKQKH